MLGKILGDDKNTESGGNLMAVSPPPVNTGQLDPSKVRRYARGDRIGNRYEVVKVLSGGMGVVYLCADHNAQMLPVALKTFKPKFLPDRKTRDRFLKEGTIWVGLKRHPNIVQAYRVERFKGGLEIYLALEWVAQAEDKEDASLREWLSPDNPLSLEQILTFALHIARGMNYAVTKIPGFIHRDLKPENILIGRDGNARVTDFGLAGVLASLKTNVWHTGTGKLGLKRTQYTMGVVGTPLYMAPEQWTKGAPLDMRADIYAFGCILYEMLTGQKAIEGKTVQEIARAHQMGQVKDLPPEFPPEIIALVRGCMAVWLDKRFQHWADVEMGVTMVYQRLVNKDAPELVTGTKTSDARAERIAEGWSYDAMGLSYLDIGNYDLAGGYFERVIWIGRSEHDTDLESAGLSHLGASCHALGDLQGAIEFHEQHLSIAESTGNKAGQSDALGNLGNVYLDLGNMRRARICYEEQLILVQDIGDQERQARAHRNLGDAALNTGDTRQAIEAYKRALSIYRNLDQRLNEGRLLGKIGIVYTELKQEQKAIQFNEEALNIAQEIGDRRGEGYAYRNLGRIHRNLGESQRVLWFLINYLHITQETGDRIGEANVLTELGNIYLEVGDISLAVESFQQALKYARKIGNKKRIGEILIGLGQAYQSEGELWQAIGFCREALIMYNTLGVPLDIVKIAHLLGNLCRDTKDLQQARQSYDTALRAMLQINDDRMKAKIKYDFAISLAMEGDQTAALDQAEQAAYLFKGLKEAQNLKKTRALIAEIRGRRRWF